MMWGGRLGGLELRNDGDGIVTILGAFPYGKPAVLSDGGRRGKPKKEIIAPRAFRYRVERPEEEIHFLVGHDFDRPLASRASGTLDLTDGDDALVFAARITAEIQRAVYVQDFLAGVASGLMIGLSPGFRIPPERVAPGAEGVEQEDPKEGIAIIRTVYEALLYELSAVTRPAYPEAQIEARTWERTPAPHRATAGVVANRWR